MPEPQQNPWFQRLPATAPVLAAKEAEARRAFAESQQAGLAAAIALAQADAAAVLEPARSRLPRLNRQGALPAAGAGAVTVPPAASAGTFKGPAGQAPTGDPATNGAGVVASPPAGDAARFSRILSYLQSPLLITILTVQAVLSLRLVWSNTAFLDEATYLAAGHVEIAHWLHGTPVPAYQTYFSGAPVVYPPIAALAASAGGLVAARLLSLAFMLGTTALLWATSSKLFGRSAAACAAAIFAVMGPTLRLGAFATFDAMALLMVAASVWCMVSAKDRDDSAWRLVAGTALLVLANATKYATLIFDPSIVAIAGLAAARNSGIKSGIARGGYVAAGAIGLLSVLLTLAGPTYTDGLLFTTVARADGGTSAAIVAANAWKWAGLAFAASAAGLILCTIRRDGRIQWLLLGVLVASGLLAPLDQVRIHTSISLSKHVDFGAWFAAIAAGYAISRVPLLFGRSRLPRMAATGAILLAIAVPATFMGTSQAWALFHSWPNSTGLVARMRVLTAEHPGRYLVEDYDVVSYYLEDRTSWQQWSGTWDISYRVPGRARPLTGLAGYRAAISRHYFALIVLDFVDTTEADRAIAADIFRSSDYSVIGVVSSTLGQYTIWAYQPPLPSGRS